MNNSDRSLCILKYLHSRGTARWTNNTTDEPTWFHKKTGAKNRRSGSIKSCCGASIVPDRRLVDSAALGLPAKIKTRSTIYMSIVSKLDQNSLEIILNVIRRSERAIRHFTRDGLHSGAGVSSCVISSGGCRIKRCRCVTERRKGAVHSTDERWHAETPVKVAFLWSLFFFFFFFTDD